MQYSSVKWTWIVVVFGALTFLTIGCMMGPDDVAQDEALEYEGAPPQMDESAASGEMSETKKRARPVRSGSGKADNAWGASYSASGLPGNGSDTPGDNCNTNGEEQEASSMDAPCGAGGDEGVGHGSPQPLDPEGPDHQDDDE
jgi:hypothetical protein